MAAFDRGLGDFSAVAVVAAELPAAVDFKADGMRRNVLVRMPSAWTLRRAQPGSPAISSFSPSSTLRPRSARHGGNAAIQSPPASVSNANRTVAMTQTRDDHCHADDLGYPLATVRADPVIIGPGLVSSVWAGRPQCILNHPTPLISFQLSLRWQA